MYCETARMILELDLARMGEADWQDLDAVETHLADCDSCRIWRDRRYQEENHLADAMRHVVVPPNLTSVLVRQSAQSRWKRWGFRSAMALAAGVVFLPLVYLAWPHSQPLDIEAAAWLLREGFEPDFDVPTDDARRITLEQRFAKLGVRTHLPESLDYGRLVFSGLVELQGRAVPHLVFSAPDSESSSWTQVLVLDSKQFELSSLPETMPTGTTASAPMLIQSGENGRYVALVAEGFRRKPAAGKASW